MLDLGVQSLERTVHDPDATGRATWAERQV